MSCACEDINLLAQLHELEVGAQLAIELPAAGAVGCGDLGCVWGGRSTSICIRVPCKWCIL